MNVLFVEDDLELIDILKRGFFEEGILLDCVTDIFTANEYLSCKEYDVLIIDKLLPDGDGLEFCKRLRSKNILVPVLILSSYSDLEDKLVGFKNGADDYLGKPFAFAELIARIRALGKRKISTQNHVLKVDNLTLNLISREVERSGKKIILRNNEFNLLAFLLKRKNQVVTKTEIIDYVWNIDNYFDPNILNVTIYNLRKKIEDKKYKKIIYTIRGIGYKISD